MKFTRKLLCACNHARLLARAHERAVRVTSGRSQASSFAAGYERLLIIKREGKLAVGNGTLVDRLNDISGV